jgi:hypothetical protein
MDAAMVRNQHEKKAQDVSNIIFAHATLLLMPAVGAWSALENAAGAYTREC